MDIHSNPSSRASGNSPKYAEFTPSTVLYEREQERMTEKKGREYN
jgi:hypothetical protein